MKYKITDSQLESVIFLYLDNQDFIPIEKGDNIYFVNSEGDEYAQIRYNKDDGWCYIHYKLVDEISSFFSLGESDSEKVIGRWVENVLQMKVTDTVLLQYPPELIVENVLQMKVTDTFVSWGSNAAMLRIPNN